MQAVSRIMDYMGYYERNVQKEYWKTGKNMYRPRGIVIIGRDLSADKNKLRQFNSHLTRIEIWTYDDLLNKGKRMVKEVESNASLKRRGENKIFSCSSSNLTRCMDAFSQCYTFMLGFSSNNIACQNPNISLERFLDTIYSIHLSIIPG